MSDETLLLIETVQLKKVYRRGKIAVPALDGVDLRIAKGEIIGILGPSGSGKSTLLNLIGGLDRPTDGKVVFDGLDLARLNDIQLTEYRRQKIGFIFQFFNLIPTLTALENVELPMSLAGVPKSERQPRALELLTTVGLAARADHMPEELSGGEQQRVAVARALANNPSVILGDEPTGDLDSKSAKTLMDLIKSLQKGKGTTFVLVTHDPIVIAECSGAYAVRDGRITRSLSAADIENARLSAKHDEAMMEGAY